MFRIFSEIGKANLIKGKIIGERGLIFPKILINDNMRQILTDNWQKYAYYVTEKGGVITGFKGGPGEDD